MALGAGWVANQEGRWPLLAWFGSQGEHDQKQEAEAVQQPIAERQEAQVAAREPAAAEPQEAQAAVTEPSAQPQEAQVVVTESPGAEPQEARVVTEPSAAEPQQAQIAVTEPPASEAQEARVVVAEPPAVEPRETQVVVTPPASEPAEAAAPSEAASPAVAEAPDNGPAPQETAASADLPSETEAAADRNLATEPAGAETASVVSGTQETAEQLVGSAADVAALTEPDDDQEPEQAGSVPTDAAGDAPAQEVAALLSDAKSTDRPSFDVVRVEPDGRAVIAGRAAPGAEVELRSGDQVIDRVHASQRGDWVAIPSKPLSPGDQQLTVVAALKGAPAVESQQMVVVAVPERASPAVSQVSGAAIQPMAVLLPRTGRGTGRILQAPGRLSAEGTLALMTVGYDPQGQMLLSGEAPPGVPVRVYVDNRPVALVVGDSRGAWSSGLDQPLAPGTYTLRLDQLDAEGQTVARIETPITRVSEPPIEGELQVDYVVVQPGNSLWRIARRLTGKGVDYVYIYDSNQAQIRDPDLIFPGQVFQIPAEVGGAG